MFRTNFMNGLLAVIAVGLLLVGYNAFVADTDGERSASERLATYLHLDVAQVEQAEDAVSQITVDEGNTNETVDVSVGEPTEEPASDDSDEATTSPAETNDESSTSDSQTSTGAVSDKSETVYTVKEGDTYACISERYYGSLEHWPEIINANPRTEGFGEYELHVGARIVLPAITAANLRPASTVCN